MQLMWRLVPRFFCCITLTSFHENVPSFKTCETQIRSEETSSFPVIRISFTQGGQAVGMSYRTRMLVRDKIFSNLPENCYFRWTCLGESLIIVLPSKWLSFCTLTPQLRAEDAEIKVPSGENTELKRSPFKAWSSSVYSHTCCAYCQRFLACLFLLFRSVHLHYFQNLSRVFLCWLWLTHGSCVGP